MFAKQTKGCLNSENLPTPQGARFRKLHARLWIFCNVNWFVGRAGACSRRKVPAFGKIHTRLNSYQTRGRNAQAHQRIVGNNLSVVPPKLYQTPRAIRESPLQRGAESTPPTHEIYCVHVGNGRTVPQTSPFIGEVARRSRDGGAKHIKIHGRAWKPATTRKYIACVGANCVRPRRGQAPALPCKMYFVRRGKTQQTPRTRKGQTNPRPITGRGF